MTSHHWGILNQWTDGWKEYCKQSGDFRYLETMKGDFAPWIEFINGIIAVLIGSYIVYGLYTKNISHINVAIAILMLSATQIFGTILYYSSYYTKCFHKLEKVDLGNDKVTAQSCVALGEAT